MWQKPTKNKESSMNDNEIGNPPIKALIVFRDNGDTDNLYVPILCDAIRTTGIDVRCSTNEFWNSDTPYDIIHFQWPEEVMENALAFAGGAGRAARRRRRAGALLQQRAFFPIPVADYINFPFSANVS